AKTSHTSTRPACPESRWRASTAASVAPPIRGRSGSEGSISSDPGLSPTPVRPQNGGMRRFAAAISFVFVTRLMLASYGHCWPMLAAQIDEVSASHDNHHGGDHKQHNHTTDGFGQELSVPGVPSGAVAIIDA